MHLINVHHLADGGIKHPLQQLHDLICQLETIVVTMIKGFSLPLYRFSTHFIGIIPLQKTDATSFLTSSTPSSPAAFIILAMMPDGPIALPHCILLRDLWIWVADTGRRWVSGSSLFDHSNSILRSIALCSTRLDGFEDWLHISVSSALNSSEVGSRIIFIINGLPKWCHFCDLRIEQSVLSWRLHGPVCITHTIRPFNTDTFRYIPENL